MIMVTDVTVPEIPTEEHRQSSVVDEGLSQDVLQSLDLSCRNFLM